MRKQPNPSPPVEAVRPKPTPRPPKKGRDPFPFKALEVSVDALDTVIEAYISTQNNKMILKAAKMKSYQIELEGWMRRNR